MSEITPAKKRDPKSEYGQTVVEDIKRPGAYDLLDWLGDNTDFFTAPASTKYHGDHAGGLVEHSLNVYRRLDRILEAHYPMPERAESIAIAALFHDVCKANTYKIGSRNAKDEHGRWIQVPYYEYDEKFAYGGHGSKSVFLIERFMRLTEEEAVAINCHMGAFDRYPGDYSIGQAFEQYPLAFWLHVADCAATYYDEGKDAKP